MSLSKVQMDSIYLRALLSVSGLGERTLHRLLALVDSPQQLWDASEVFLKAHFSEKQRLAFLKQRDQGLQPEWFERYQASGVQTVPITSPFYPPLLREIHGAPLLLYVKGRIEALTGRTLAVVGTRNTSHYGQQVTSMLVSELKNAQVTVVSGLAAGIDTLAHWAALRNELPTVAVYGCGLDIVTPVSNRGLSERIVEQDGALVSEFPLGTQPDRYTFPKRNRIVAGLSYGVLVVEGDIRSGALITARMAVEEGRTVLAVPGNVLSPGSQGPFQLIKAGAVPVSQGKDILQELGWHIKKSILEEQISLLAEPKQGITPVMSAQTEPALPTHLTEEQQRVLQSIPMENVAIEQLQQTLGLPSAKINEILTLLELDGLIVLLPGAQVCRS